jgi:hypothetical protein
MKMWHKSGTYLWKWCITTHNLANKTGTSSGSSICCWPMTKNSCLSVWGKGTLWQTRWPRGYRGIASLFLDLSTRRGGGSAPCSGHFTPGKDPVPIVQEAGWGPGPVWTCAKNLASTRIQSLDRPAHSQSLYQLSYPPAMWGLSWNTKELFLSVITTNRTQAVTGTEKTSWIKNNHRQHLQSTQHKSVHMLLKWFNYCIFHCVAQEVLWEGQHQI